MAARVCSLTQAFVFTCYASLVPGKALFVPFLSQLETPTQPALYFISSSPESQYRFSSLRVLTFALASHRFDFNASHVNKVRPTLPFKSRISTLSIKAARQRRHSIISWVFTAT